MPDQDARKALALEMISTLPTWGTWAATMRDVETPHGKVGYRQSSILWILRNELLPPEERSTTGIAAHTRVQNSVVTRACERLEHLGLIQRIVHAEDRRRSTIEITEAGREASIYIERLFTESIVGEMQELDDSEIADLQKSVRHLAAMINKLMLSSPGT